MVPPQVKVKKKSPEVFFAIQDAKRSWRQSRLERVVHRRRCQTGRLAIERQGDYVVPSMVPVQETATGHKRLSANPWPMRIIWIWVSLTQARCPHARYYRGRYLYCQSQYRKIRWRINPRQHAYLLRHPEEMADKEIVGVCLSMNRNSRRYGEKFQPNLLSATPSQICSFPPRTLKKECRQGFGTSTHLAENSDW